MVDKYGNYYKDTSKFTHQDWGNILLFVSCVSSLAIAAGLISEYKCYGLLPLLGGLIGGFLVGISLILVN